MAGLTCSYEPSTKKRGLPEGYVRGLEKLFALCIGKIDGFDEAISATTKDNFGELSRIWNQDTFGEDLHRVWKESRILSEFEILLSSSEKESTAGSKRKYEDDAGESASSGSSTTGFHRRWQYRLIDTNNLPREFSTETTGSLRPEKSNSAASNLPVTTPQYLEHYFAFTHCWFPILDRPSILRSYYEISKRSITTSSTSAELALLWAIAVLTEHQSRDPTLMGDVNSASRQWQEKSLSYIPTEMKHLKIGHIQALLILSLLDLGNGEWAKAWGMVGKATRGALLMTTHPRSSEQKLNTVIQACVILDTLIASHLELPPHLRRCDLARIGHSEEDGHDEWEPWFTPKASTTSGGEPAFRISCFNRLFDILLVLNDLLACEHLTGTARRDFFAKLQKDLEEVEAKFPGQPLPASQLPPHHMILRLYHLSTSTAVLKQLFEGGAPHLPLAQSACRILTYLSEYVKSPSLGLSGVPPILENPVRASCYAAIASKPVFGISPTLPEYIVFAQEMTDHVSLLSAIWPVFRTLSTLWKTLLHSHSKGANLIQNNAPSEDQTKESFPFLRQGAFESSFPSVKWSFGGATATQSVLANETERNLLSMAGKGAIPIQIPNPGLFQVTGRQGGPSTTVGNGLGMFSDSPQETQASIPGMYDISMSGTEPVSAGTMILPSSQSSPSFQGDEVDAIFHNLVHLDANEWANTNSGSFQELGFADNSSFQAFCDDPDRLRPGSFGDQAGNISLDFWRPDTVASFGGFQQNQESWRQLS